MFISFSSRLSLVALATVAVPSAVRAEVYLVGYKTVYVIPARDPYEEQRFEMDRAYAVAYDRMVDQEEADLHTVDDLASRHPRDADLLERMRDRIRGDIENDADEAARRRDEMLAAWYTSAPNVYATCPEMVAVYRRERPVSVVEVKFSKGHRNDTYVMREPYRGHRVEPMDGIVYGKRLKSEDFRRVVLVASTPREGRTVVVRSGWGGPPVKVAKVEPSLPVIKPVKPITVKSKKEEKDRLETNREGEPRLRRGDKKDSAPAKNAEKGKGDAPDKGKGKDDKKKGNG